MGRTDQGGGDQEIFPCLFTFNSKGKRQEFHLVLQEVRKANFENFFVRSLASILTLGKNFFFYYKKFCKRKIFEKMSPEKENSISEKTKTRLQSDISALMSPRKG